MNNDRVSSIGILIVSVMAYYSVSGMSQLAALFPEVVSVIMAFFALLLLIRSFVRPKKDKWFEEADVAYLIWVVIGFVIYIILVFFIGFFMSSLVFIIFYSWLLGAKRKSFKMIGISAIVGIVTTISVYVIFKFVFLVPLTHGVLFGGD